MARWSSYLLLLVLLVPVISLCESAEYHIRPTALTTNTSCPGQPCLTLNHYINNTSHYIQSNTVLNFLPGKHVLKRPLQINNVQNVTLKSSTTGSGMHSQLLVRFSCENESITHCISTQSAIEMINVTNVIINDITFEMWTPNVSGVIVEQSTDVHLQLDIHSVQGNDSLAAGVTVNETSYLYIDGLQVGNLYNGIRIENTNKVSIINSAFDNCQNSGMVIINSDAIDISNTTLSNNMENGMYLESCNNATLTSISATNNQQDGMDLISCSSVSLKDISVINNSRCGLNKSLCINTDLKNINATNNKGIGVFLSHCKHVRMMMMLLEKNRLGMRSIFSSHMRHTSISAKNNRYDGVNFYSCKNTTMMSISVINNRYDGLYFFKCENTTMMNVSAINNQDHGIYFYSCENTAMMNVSATNNKYDGMHLYSCKNTIMMNISAKNNRGHGMHFYSCENTTMINISAINNQWDGIYIESSEKTTVADISTINNQYGEVHVDKCENTIITNVFAINNMDEGVIQVNCTNTILTDIYAAYNQNGGIVIENHLQNIILRNISVNHNEDNQITFSSSDNIQLEYSTFSDIIALPTLNMATNPHTMPAVIELNDCTLIMCNCIFTRNNITSIIAIGSKIIPEGEIIFSDNNALSGAALLFVSSSVLVISESSSVRFQNNHALNYGGAIYILTDENYTKSVFTNLRDLLFFNPSIVTPRTRCFLSVEGNRSQARLVFTNNTADKGGDVVYGGLLALGYDGNWNCLLSFKNISYMSQQNGLSTISSEPSRVCLCHDGQPDCLTVADPITRNIYPGQTITVPAVVVGQDFGTVTGSVIPQFLQDYTTCPIQFEQGQKSTFVNIGQCADLKYTLYSSGGENCTAVLALKTNNAEVLQPMNRDDNHKLNNSWTILNEEPNYFELARHLLYQTISPTSNYSEAFVNNFLKFDLDKKLVFPHEIYNCPTFINISFRSCPLGFALSRNPPFKCDCNHLLQHMPRVKCEIQNQTISRDGLVWVGTYGNNTVAASKYCPYNYCKSERTKVKLTSQESKSESINHSTTNIQCNLHHSGVLCGGCQPGLSLALGTNQCLRCSNIYISLILPFAMAGLFLVFFIKLLNLTISQGTINELIFYVNVISANKHLYYSQTNVNPMTLFIAWLNLDIGIETCFFNGLTAYSRTWLQFVFPLYIWAIAGLIIIIAKYSDRVAKVMGNNGVPVLATLFLLSYAKLFNTIITAMSYTILYTTQGWKLVWSADGNLDYLGPKHIPLFCVAVAALVFLWFPYTLLLLLGQWLHRLNYHIITRMLLNLKPFLDAHFAAFKDKHRYWFGFLLLVRAAYLLISAIIPDSTTELVEFSTAILCILLTLWGQIVYCSRAVWTFGTAFLLNLAIMNLIMLFSGNIAITLIAIALAQFLGLILYKVVVIFKCSRRMMTCCARENEPYDDWELYEQAALEREQAALVREMESESEEDRESNESRSIESVPSYGI